MANSPNNPKNTDQEKGQPSHRNELIRSLSFLSQIGVTIVACIVIGILIGRFLDNILGTSPWLLLIFIFLGIGAAFKSILDLAKRK